MFVSYKINLHIIGNLITNILLCLNKYEFIVIGKHIIFKLFAKLTDQVSILTTKS